MDEGSAATTWWVVAGVLVVVELLSGTVYLLMTALGMVAGALMAHLGASVSVQLVAAALVGGGATLGWHRYHRQRQKNEPSAEHNRNVNLDVGERVHVEAWGVDGMARVNYRGSMWTARLAPGASPSHGLHIVIAVEANRLVLSPVTAL